MPLRPIPVLFCVALGAGCTQFPDLDSAISPGAERAAYPKLVPAEQLQARVPVAQVDPESISSLEARVANLRSRAARLRGTVIDSSTRTRMTTGIPAI
ncbi:hypothetical protein [Roseovarius sp. 2305UL8-3]|uniref:hypothetical protein n=1 Tax=Roseovarius conchicola TaxID=3121636 RepID=UPI003527E49F